MPSDYPVNGEKNKDEPTGYEYNNETCDWTLFTSVTVTDVNNFVDSLGSGMTVDVLSLQSSAAAPLAVLPYYSVIKSLHQILLREGAESLIVNHWRRRKYYRKVHPGFMTDVYDGQMWEDYQ